MLPESVHEIENASSLDCCRLIPSQTHPVKMHPSGPASLFPKEIAPRTRKRP